MSGLTEEQLELAREKVADRLDKPAKAFLSETTIQTLLSAAFTWIDGQMEITTSNKAFVIAAIYDITAWRAFVAYGESITDQLQLQSVIAFNSKVKSLKEIAQMSCSLLNLNLDKKPFEDVDEIVVSDVSTSDLDVSRISA